MAAKYQLITELYQRTGKTVTRNPQAWQNFLSSACRNYKCRFDEQLLIYAQRPDAVAVTTIEVWNKLFKRWVNKDSKGIAVFDTKGRRNTLKYFFDVSDTHEGYYGSRPVPIWQMNGRYEQAVIERLSDRFGGAENGGLAEVLMETAKNAVEDNLQDYTAQLKGCVKDSFLEELDDYNIEVMYRELATNSVAYMLMARCGIDTAEYFDREDFGAVVNFKLKLIVCRKEIPDKFPNVIECKVTHHIFNRSQFFFSDTVRMQHIIITGRKHKIVRVKMVTFKASAYQRD